MDFTLSASSQGKTTLVNQTMMIPAKEYEIVDMGFATIGPMVDVVCINKAGTAAAWKAATTIAAQ